MAAEIHPESEIAELEVKLGVSFNNRDYLRQALTHESFINEWGAENHEVQIESYERLEYLGDAVLNYAVANALFERSALLTKASCRLAGLLSSAKILWLVRLRISILATTSCEVKGEISYSPHVRDSVLEDSFEAIIGAIHEDQGFEAARRFVFDQLGDKIEKVAKNGVAKDPKSAFQELVQGIGLKTPRYRTEMLPKAVSGEQHFRARVMIDGREVATGIGESKSKAQKNAAAKASELFSNGVPPRFVNSTFRRRTTETGSNGRLQNTASSNSFGVAAGGVKRIASWVNVVVLRRRGSTPRRRLILKRSK